MVIPLGTRRLKSLLRVEHKLHRASGHNTRMTFRDLFEIFALFPDRRDAARSEKYSRVVTIHEQSWKSRTRELSAWSMISTTFFSPPGFRRLFVIDLSNLFPPSCLVVGIGTGLQVASSVAHVPCRYLPWGLGNFNLGRVPYVSQFTNSVRYCFALILPS